MGIELKPCPFCGSKAYAYEIPAHKHVIPMGIPDYDGGAFVECTKCTAAVSGTNLENALKAWNRRIESKPQWIPVTERLPDENQPVCILLENGNVFRAEIRIRQLLKEWWYRYDPTDEDMDMLGIYYEVEGWLKENSVVAWTPLPEPYTPAGEEDADV